LQYVARFERVARLRGKPSSGLCSPHAGQRKVSGNAASLEVLDRALDHIGIIAESAQTRVAAKAQHGANLAGSVIVVNLSGGVLAAQSADAPLVLDQRGNFIGADAESLPEVIVTSVSVERPNRRALARVVTRFAVSRATRSRAAMPRKLI
jgi:hypothetical protein